MKKLTAFVVTLFLTASFAWGQAASPTRTMRKAGGQQQELNAQPLAPGKKVELNPQPLPPKLNSAAMTGPNGNLTPGTKVGFNPQPDPPGVQKHMDASSPK
ncbi:MAG TPA: hypothetical protein VKL40_01135 [Candidatus Angelobacter sp.]|nr:hypothetical protein [Candidatus Angelobacter sp.]